MEHSHTSNAMANLAATYRHLGKNPDAEKLETQVCELQDKVLRAGSSHTTMANVQEAQDIQVLDAGSTVPGEENLHSTQVVLNHSVQAVLPNTPINPEKKGMSLVNYCLNSL